MASTEAASGYLESMCIAEGADETLRSSSTADRQLVQIESDPLCKAHYFTHPQNGQTLATYGDVSLIEEVGRAVR